MAKIKITDFDLDRRSGNRVKVTATFNLLPTKTERRLKIPFLVELWLYEKDGVTDMRNIYYSRGRETTYYRDRDERGGRIYSGQHSGTITKTVTKTFDRSDLPGELGAEEWYVYGECIPDIYADIALSEQSRLNLA